MSDKVDHTMTGREDPVEAVKPAEIPIISDTVTEPKESVNTAEAPTKETDAAAAPPTSAEESKPAKEEPKAEPKIEKPAYLTKTPALNAFFDRLPTILSTVGHDEMWGVQLKDYNDVPTVNVMIKFLRANEGNAKAAEEQLSKALKWRKEVNPLQLAESGNYSAAKYEGLGYLTIYEDNGKPLVFTWNIYGAVKDVNATFASSDEFLKWRAALMELAVQELKMKDATEVIDYEGEDPYQMIQVHDYLNVKFLRMDPAVRSATKKVIDVFATSYPELLREKFFVNVPAIMGWMFAAMKLILSRNTTRKFHPITNGANLAREFSPSIIDKIPKVYGGKGPELKENAKTVPLTKESETPKQELAAEEPAKEAPKETPKEAAKETANDTTKDTSQDAVKEEVPKEEANKVPVQEEAPKVEAPREEPVKTEAQ